jgi:Cu-processing system permease protein
VNALVVARFTIQEAISRRLILAGVVISLAFIALFALGFSLLYGMALEEQGGQAAGRTVTVFAATLLTVLGLYSVHFLSSFLALFLSVGSISGEIDSGTLHAVLARPLRRLDFVLGRWLAYVALMFAYVGAMAGLVLLVAFLIAGYEPTDAPRTIGLMALGSVLLLSVSLFGSTILSTLANGVVVFSLFGLAWMAGIIEFVGQALDNQGMVNLGIVVSLLIPSDGIWRAASYYAQSQAFLVASSTGPEGFPFFSTLAPALPFVVWAALYPVVFLVAGALAFARRDL